MIKLSDCVRTVEDLRAYALDGTVKIVLKTGLAYIYNGDTKKWVVLVSPIVTWSEGDLVKTTVPTPFGPTGTTGRVSAVMPENRMLFIACPDGIVRAMHLDWVEKVDVVEGIGGIL